MGQLTKAIGGAIGMTQEAMAQHRESKASENDPHATTQVAADEQDDEYSDDDDETGWRLDDAQEEAAPGSSSTDGTRDVQELLKQFQQQHPTPSGSPSAGLLPCPVLLPQRRPAHKDRGFVRAYAPALQDCGIDQPTFFRFLDGFGQAIRMHPIFHAVNLSVLGAALAIDAIAGPSITAHAVAFVLHASVEASRRGYIQYETNKFLDGMNDQLFKPHGLYAMVMTYKPDSSSSLAVVDPSKQIVDAVSSRSDGHGGKFSSSSGKTTNELEIPEVCPLIFPDLDAMPEEKKQNMVKKTGVFMSDYFDRRSQADFDHKNPDSKLSVPRKEFASIYSDPNHPANSGSMVALVSGGKKLGVTDRLRQRRKEKKGGDGLSLHKKMLKQNVLYLMIVNMPSEEELRASAAKTEHSS